MEIELIDITQVDKEIQMQVREWRNSKEVSQYFILDNISVDVHKNWLHNLEKFPEQQKAFLISYKDKFIGLTYFRNIDESSCDWGIFIYDNKHRGIGIGSSVLDLSIDYAFSKLNLRQINLEVLENNTSAIKLYQKKGFQFKDVSKFKIINDKKINVLNMSLSFDKIIKYN